MKQIKRRYIVVATLAVAGLMGLQTAQAGVIVASDLTVGSSSYTTADTLVTLTPYASITNAGTVGTFGTGADFFGVGADNKIKDVDGNPATTGDREAIDIALDATVGLDAISFKWTRAAGDAPDGVVISGFLADPVATTSSGVGITYSAGALYLNYGWDVGAIRTFDFSNIAASAGQTLRVSVNDVDNAGPQGTINTISYAIPEPATFGLLAAMGGGLLFIRRRFQK